MSSNVEILPVHGWGFDNSAWDKFRGIVPNGVSLLTWDRGYFDEPMHVEFSGTADVNVLLAHSFGVHLMSQSWLEQADMLVILGGFIAFHPGTPQFRKRSRAVLKDMIEKLHQNTEEVLSDFYENCFSPHSCPITPAGHYNKEILMKDLSALNHAKLNLSPLQKIPVNCIIHGADDRIVPNMKGRELYRQLGDKAKYYEIKKTGHALPITDTKTCWQFIEPEIDARLN